MPTLIVPCAGRSSRFPGMRPKWMLSHPDGKLMVQKSIEGLPLEKFDRIIITVVKEHSEKFDAKIVLDQVFDLTHNKKIEVLELENFTTSQADTVYQTLIQKKVEGSFVVKDSDNHVRIDSFPRPEFIVGLNIHHTNQEVRRLKSKSFLMVNEQGLVVDIIEKRIRSEIVCLGVYGFDSPKKFQEAFLSLQSEQKEKQEIYLSHVISYLIGTGTAAYSYVETQEFEDWGTLEDWRDTQKRHSSYFVDIDGVLLENRGKYGKENWGNTLVPIEENIAVLKNLYVRGAQIILTTARSEADLDGFKKLMAERGIIPHAYVTNCNHAPRVIINDFAPTNPFPAVKAVNMPRNGSLATYLD